MRIAITPDRPYSGIIKYTLQLIGINKQNEFKFVDTQADVMIGDPDATDVPLAYSFYTGIQNGETSHEHVLDSQGLVSQDGVTDHLASIFYLSNAIQEHNPKSSELDEYGRFRYDASCQKKFNTIEENVVQQQIDYFCKRNLPDLTLKAQENSTVFLSHDIDALYGSLVHDSWWALKRGRIGVMLQALIKNVTEGPQWFCIDKIARMHSEKDLVSTFFWMTEQGEYNKVRNADYEITNKRIQKSIRSTANRGFSHGIHKSSYNTSIEQEALKLPVTAVGNRYHYLKFNIPDAWRELDKSGLSLDASLGFAGHTGFRNNYGMPFCPYDQKKEKAFSFLEVPLHIMDITFEKYMNINRSEIANRTIAFLEKHNRNAVISILWHNMYFVPYQFADYLEQYKNILLYLYESDYRSITPAELTERYAFSEVGESK